MKICVFGAASDRIDKAFIDAVEKIGEEIAKRGHSLVFGGGASGLMGAAARGFSRAGGSILGVAPRFFDTDGVLYDRCTEFIYTDTMRQRKQILEERSDAFIVTPGGVGTFDEFFEIITLKQLGRHSKPVVIFNVANFFDALENLMEKALSDKFLSPKTLELYKITDSINEVIDYLESYKEKEISVKDTKYIRG